MTAKQIFLKIAFDCWKLELPDYRKIENYIQNVLLAVVFQTDLSAVEKIPMACLNLGLNGKQTEQIKEIINTALVGMNQDSEFQKELLDNPALARMELCKV